MCEQRDCEVCGSVMRAVALRHTFTYPPAVFRKAATTAAQGFAWDRSGFVAGLCHLALEQGVWQWGGTAMGCVQAV